MASRISWVLAQNAPLPVGSTIRWLTRGSVFARRSVSTMPRTVGCVGHELFEDAARLRPRRRRRVRRSSSVVCDGTEGPRLKRK